MYITSNLYASLNKPLTIYFRSLQYKTITFAGNFMNMKIKQIRFYIKNAILIVLSMIVMAGVTGLSYQAHYCHNKLSGIAFYPELGFQQSISCGCAIDAKPMNSGNTDNQTVLKKNSCCSNISFFSKLIIESPVIEYTKIISALPATIAININFPDSYISQHENLLITDTGFLPVPLAGRKLVLFLSQQRIPLISYTC